MKKIVLVGAVVFYLVACENSAKVESKADSLKEKLDTMLEKVGDSAKAKGEQTLEAIKEKVRDIETDKDSVRTDSIK